jgi:hypothetical protein
VLPKKGDVMVKKVIVYSELLKTFKLEDGKLFRLFRGEWGEIKGCKASNGYRKIDLNGEWFKAHRLIYSLANKCDVDSSLYIDHINGIRDDNHPENLRLVTTRENQQNRLTHRRGRLVGCYWNKQCKKWHAQIEINKKHIFLGLYPTEEEAHEAYLIALQSLEGGH